MHHIDHWCIVRRLIRCLFVFVYVATLFICSDEDVTNVTDVVIVEDVDVVTSSPTPSAHLPSIKPTALPDDDDDDDDEDDGDDDDDDNVEADGDDHGQKTTTKPSAKPTKKPTSAPTSSQQEHSITYVSTGFTLNRANYGALSYFAAPDSVYKRRQSASYLQYQILDGYLAVIEPYSDMYLSIDGYDPTGMC
jgi:hypothetical protein